MDSEKLRSPKLDESERPNGGRRGSCPIDREECRHDLAMGAARCDPNRPASINEYLEANRLRQHANETIEERSHARLIQAIEGANQFKIKAAQELYVRASETLRRLDLAVETERRTAREQIPMRQIENVSRQISEWLRIALEQFLSAESPPV